MLSHEIRQSFIDFFVERDHRHHPSAPLVPQGDPTLLFTNAGMVQFKNYFLGLEPPEHRRAVTSQKCLRVSGKHNDLENVGPSLRHHTFFEMLGNFSFGDYFKEEAITFGWDLVTRVWGLAPEHLFATVFEEDDEAYELWLELSSLPAEQVKRCGMADNFWAMGETGPCGPCSEIFADTCPGRPKVPWAEGSESGRYVEIWNLVFMQFERQEGGELRPLPRPSVDTGSGLERVTAVLQGAESTYDTDLFRPILIAAAELAGKRYGEEPRDDISLRVVADHLRALAFLLADGVIPANEGRGYVLRRILRRAVRHGLHLGLEEPFLAALVPVLGGIMGAHYPELGATEAASRETIRTEEEKFLSTLASGARQVQEAIEAARQGGATELDGATAFRLYDTHGLPLDMVQEIAEEERFPVDEAGFEAALEEQRRRSRTATSASRREDEALREVLELDALADTRFDGYDRLSLEGAEVLRLARGGDRVAAVAALEAGEQGVVILDRTVFYAEGGGQVGDRGELRWPAGRARVLDTQRKAGIFLHHVQVEAGRLELGTRLELELDTDRRRQTERHHTATHLLHAALRERLGEGVRQAGSLVHPERLRFDFTYGGPLSDEERDQIEGRVNEWVRQAVPVEIDRRPYEEALEAGAMALFGEKYGDEVRTVAVPPISLELCGGCHVANSGQIGSFRLLSERGVASGVRRIEAVSGRLADLLRRSQEEALRAVEAELGVPGERAAAEIVALKERLRERDRQVAELRRRLVSGDGESMEESRPIEVDGIRILTREVPPAPSNELRELADVLRGRLGSGVVVLGARDRGRVNLVTAVSKDLTEKVDAGRLARRMGDLVGGSGGGRRDFAQAGGREPQRLQEALAAVARAVEEQLQEAG